MNEEQINSIIEAMKQSTDIHVGDTAYVLGFEHEVNSKSAILIQEAKVICVEAFHYGVEFSNKKETKRLHMPRHLVHKTLRLAESYIEQNLIHSIKYIGMGGYEKYQRTPMLNNGD